MSVPIAYVTVVLIWSTTPLAVQWSNDSLGPVAAVTLRMTTAWLVTLLVGLLLRLPLFDLKRNWRIYLVASLGIFPNMPLVNLAAEYIPSGLIAVIFGTSPVFVAMLSSFWLGEGRLLPRQYIAIIIAVTGLAIIFHQHVLLDDRALVGIALMLASVMLFATSSVLIKRYAVDVHPMQQIFGSLSYALPGLLLYWVVFSGEIPQTISQKSFLSVAYLAIVGSMLGFIGYFYLLRKLPAAAVSMITLLSPLLAVWFGVTLNHEPITPAIAAGSALVVMALLLFTNVLASLLKVASKYYRARRMAATVKTIEL